MLFCLVFVCSLAHKLAPAPLPEAGCQAVDLFDSRAINAEPAHVACCQPFIHIDYSMQKLKATLRRHYSKGYDSDSTGYCSSSSDRPISRSQFILTRPSTALTTYSPFPGSYADYPSTSYSFHDSGLGSQEEEENEVAREEDGSTIRARSVMTVIDCGRHSSCKSPPFPFDEADDDLGDLFDQLELDDRNEAPMMTPMPSEVDGSTLNRKRLHIKDPDESSKIYFAARLKKRSLPKNGSIPRSILKKEPSLFHMHIYEEIEDDHLDPLPEDPPERPRVQPIKIFPPCKTFQPRRLELPRYPSIKRRKKLPSLHKSSKMK